MELRPVLRRREGGRAGTKLNHNIIHCPPFKERNLSVQGEESDSVLAASRMLTFFTQLPISHFNELKTTENQKIDFNFHRLGDWCRFCLIKGIGCMRV